MKAMFLGNPSGDRIGAVQRSVDAVGSKIDEVIILGGRGLYPPAREWALSLGIPVLTYVANWGKHGRDARAKRNQEAVTNVDILVILAENLSKDERHVEFMAKVLRIPIYRP